MFVQKTDGGAQTRKIEQPPRNHKIKGYKKLNERIG